MLRSTLDFAVAIQFVRQVEHAQRGAFEGAQMQIAGFGSFGLQHCQEFNVSCGTGRKDHFTDRAVMARREQRRARLGQLGAVRLKRYRRRLSLPRYCMRATISWPV